MIENLIIENINNLYYKATPELGYLILIPADEEEEKVLAAEYGETVEDYITTVAYLPLSYDFTVNPMNISAIKNKEEIM